MTPWLSDPDFDLYVGDAETVLRGLPDACVDCCVTSPPYWALRDYGVDGQLGLEATPEEFVSNLVTVFREVRRVLTDTGTLWLNLGDSYAAGKAGRTDHGSDDPTVGLQGNSRGAQPPGQVIPRRAPDGLKSKDLVGIPWMTAFALRADGWYLRSEIIWAKKNCMPESVTDRPTKSHEQVFLLSKRPTYYFDQEAVREPHSPDGRTKTVHDHETASSHSNYDNVGNGNERWPNGGRNIRSVWEIATQPYPDAHFATFPEELARRCIAAGCPEWVCGTCSKPRERLVERESTQQQAKWSGSNRGNGVLSGGGHNGRTGGWSSELTATAWSDCGHDDYRPGTVLDPFMGSGTTALVARKLGRRSVGVELSEEYARLAARRLQQLSLLA